MSDNPSPADKDKIADILAIIVAKGDEQKAAIDTTRRALDPKALAEHVADNNDAFMGKSVQAFAKGIQLNHDAANANIGAARDTAATTKDLAAKLAVLDQESRRLASIAERLEERDTRSKWDWVTLATGMAVAAALAGGGAFYFAKANIERDDFSRSIQLISQDDNASWCRLANGQGVKGESGTQYCAIAMPEYQVPEPEE